MLGFYHGQPIDYFCGVDMCFRPKWLMAHNDHPAVRSRFHVELYDSLAEFIEKHSPASILFRRSHALGDILMLMAVVRSIRRSLDYKGAMTMAVHERYLETLRPLTEQGVGMSFCKDQGLVDYGADVHCDLVGVLEMDHYGGETANHHRCAILGRAMGFEVSAG